MPQSFVMARAAALHVQPSESQPRHQYAASLAMTQFFTPSSETSGLPSMVPVVLPVVAGGVAYRIRRAQPGESPEVNVVSEMPAAR